MKPQQRMNALLLLLIVNLSIGVSCDNSDGFKQNVEFSLLGKGELYGNGSEMIQKSNLVIKDSTSWNELMAKMDSVNEVSTDFTETDIDFENYLVIAVFDEIRNYGGYSIDIIEINEYDQKIIVKIAQILKGGVNAVITQPFHLVKINKSEKSIIFEQ